MTTDADHQVNLLLISSPQLQQQQQFSNRARANTQQSFFSPEQRARERGAAGCKRPPATPPSSCTCESALRLSSARRTDNIAYCEQRRNCLSACRKKDLFLAVFQLNSFVFLADGRNSSRSRSSSRREKEFERRKEKEKARRRKEGKERERERGGNIYNHGVRSC